MDGTPPGTPQSQGQHVPSRYTTAEDELKSETIGLVKLDDFRKRRADILERRERERRDAESGKATPVTGSSTPVNRTASPQPASKKRKIVAKGKLSFGLDGDDEQPAAASSALSSSFNTPRSGTPAADRADITAAASELPAVVVRMRPNSSIGRAPRIMTKAGLAKEAQMTEQLRKEYVQMQEMVKATEILIPFVFYDGTNTPGGSVRMKKGDPVWLFLEKARKLGAESGVGGGEKGKREWARISVDDLMLVRNEIIIPHRNDFYSFISRRTMGHNGPIFDFAATPPAPGSMKKDKESKADVDFEGAQDDPTITKVVDKNWFKKNKHIFPASVWEEYDPKKDYTSGVRKDAEGNIFFFG